MAQGPLAEESEGPLMSPIVLPTAYLAPITYYAVLYAADEVVIEAQEHYTKQTLRTRCTIATDQGPQTLSVNVEKGNKLKMPIREVRLSSHGDWQRQHLYSWATYYGNSPFYEYYIDDLRETFLHGHDGTLFGMNEALRRHICREIGFEPKVRYSEQWMGPLDCVAPNGTFKPETFSHVLGMVEVPAYYQVAGVEGRQPFMADVSILDLLFNMGPEGVLVLEGLRGVLRGSKGSEGFKRLK